MPKTLNPNATSWLVYNDSQPLLAAPLLDEFSPFDDITLVPTDGEELFQDPDYSISLTVQMENLGDGAN